MALRFGQELKEVPLSMIAKEVCVHGGDQEVEGVLKAGILMTDTDSKLGRGLRILPSFPFFPSCEL